MLECCHKDKKAAMTSIDNKYGLIKFTNFYQINHNFSNFSTKARAYLQPTHANIHQYQFNNPKIFLSNKCI